MRINNKIRLGLSLFLAFLAVVLTYTYLTKSEDKVTIIVAKEDIEKGEKIAPELLEEKSIPREVKDSYFKDSFESIEKATGCVTRQKIGKGQPVLADPQKLAMGEELMNALTKEGKVNNAYFIPEDSRLVTIEVDNSGSVNFSIKKGDYVDVVFSSVDESTGGLYSNILLEHIEVYDVQKVITDEEGTVSKKQNITLIGTAQECLKMIAGNRNGVLDLVLNPLRGKSENVKPVNILSYSVSKPASKEEELNGLMDYINKFDMAAGTKKQILNILSQER